jgi:hypothetical protein
MQSGIEVLCEVCCLPVEQNEGTTIHSEHYGRTFNFTFHNRHAGDCMNTYLANLRKEFETKPQ